ncbi:unnamed protein product [Rotaria magnacalcarata]|uniref:Uncharacterized protein n=1 Tax=Rotaria magnacalcarata TaxID=392030 RepID=A0A820MUC9_9BILA|nr:unnamed protein product [Rotaria magnacalcarata]CAF4378145.1 unnamed protein product [Rotaria magnacalcarata]
MVRKKSASSKTKTRKEAYKRCQQLRLNAIHSWRILILAIKAVKKFLSFRHNNAIITSGSKRFCILQSDSINLGYYDYRNNTTVQNNFFNNNNCTVQFDDLHIVKDTIKKLISRVCRLDYERKRQMKNRKLKSISNSIINSDMLIEKQCRQRIWSKIKYSQNTSFREDKIQRSITYIRNNCHNNDDFRMRENKRIRNHILLKYRNDINYRLENNTLASRRILNKYHNNLDFRNQYKEREKIRVLQRYHSDHSIRLKMIQNASNLYRNNNTLMKRNSRQLYKQRKRILKKYSIVQSHTCTLKHRNLYIESVKEFRKIIKEGPDYICISCGISLFRHQVLQFFEEKYLKKICLLK